MILVVYVDDIVLTGNDAASISTFKEYLQCTFDIIDLGLLHYFLGIEVARFSQGRALYLSASMGN